MANISLFHEAFNYEGEIEELAKYLRMALLANDIDIYFSLVSLIKESFREVEKKVVDENVFRNFIKQCERSELLLASLCEEYLKAKVRYRWLKVLNK